MQKPKILVMNGPNLNMLGRREPAIYGNLTLDAVNLNLMKEARKLGLAVKFFQSNHEGALIDKLQEVYDIIDGLVINPAGLTHTSVALRDAVSIIKCPVIEVHISNINEREAFRQVSLIEDIVNHRVIGLGTQGYSVALVKLAEILSL